MACKTLCCLALQSLIEIFFIEHKHIRRLKLLNNLPTETVIQKITRLSTTALFLPIKRKLSLWKEREQGKSPLQFQHNQYIIVPKLMLGRLAWIYFDVSYTCTRITILEVWNHLNIQPSNEGCVHSTFMASLFTCALLSVQRLRQSCITHCREQQTAFREIETFFVEHGQLKWLG